MSLIYPLAKVGMETAQIDIMGHPIRIALLSAVYIYNAVHQFRSSLSGVIALSSALASKDNTNGVFRAADIVLPSVTNGFVVTQIVGYIDTGAAATDNLIWLEDGLSMRTNGADVTVHFDPGAYGIFAL